VKNKLESWTIPDVDEDDMPKKKEKKKELNELEKRNLQKQQWRNKNCKNPSVKDLEAMLKDYADKMDQVQKVNPAFTCINMFYVDHSNILRIVVQKCEMAISEIIA